MKQVLLLAAVLCGLALITSARAQDFYVGSNTPANTLDLTNGTNAYANTYIGFGTGANSNTLNVLNTNTLLTNSSEISVGVKGSGNNLVISNGGTVASAAGYIGFTNSSSSNSVLVTGTSSVWTNTLSLRVGNRGAGNSLVISNGGTVVVASNTYIGQVSTNNSVLVTDGGTWTNSNSIYVGYQGSSSSLVISDGGTVWTKSATFGFTSSNNSALVTGTNSLWTITSLLVGLNGGGNSLVISNGGTVASSFSHIGFASISSNNSVLVTGAGSLWTNSDSIFSVGFMGSGSSLTVAGGGTVAASGLTIAVSNGSSGTLNIGRFGTNDTGGTIISPTMAFGAGTGAINFNQNDAVTITSAISGAGTLSQLGAGTTTLTASNTYTGATTVAAGRLIVDGSIAGSTVTVNNGGTLGGSGAVGGIVLNLGSTLSPGNSPGTTSVAGNVVWNAGANYNWQIYDTTLGAGTGWDLVSATGSLDLTALTVGSEFNINLWSLNEIGPDVNGNALNFDPNQNYTWTILTASGGISGFTGSSQFLINTGAINGTGGFANALNGGSFSVVQDNNDLNLVFTSAPVPEPGTWAAAALLAGGAAFMRWRKRAKVS